MAQLKAGDFAPMFVTPSSVNASFRMDTTGGRRVILFFMASMTAPGALDALRSLVDKAQFFQDQRALTFVVSADAADQADETLVQRASPYVVFWDLQLSIFRQYGLVGTQQTGESTVTLGSMVLDESGRVLAFVPLRAPERHGDEIADILRSLPGFPPSRRVTHQPPVLLVPDVISPIYCRELIAAYEAHGGAEGESFFEVDGKRLHMRDHYHKRRSDWLVRDKAILAPLHAGVAARVAPEVKKAFHFSVSALERDLVGCYDASSGGHFRPHRDDNVPGTAHRRYALTINLNSEDYDGGDLRFPEYSLDTYRPPTGGAIVFSSSLMHEVLPVTSGRRYAFVSFLLSPETTMMLSDYIKEQIAAGRSSEFLME